MRSRDFWASWERKTLNERATQHGGRATFNLGKLLHLRVRLHPLPLVQPLVLSDDPENMIKRCSYIVCFFLKKIRQEPLLLVRALLGKHNSGDCCVVLAGVIWPLANGVTGQVASQPAVRGGGVLVRAKQRRTFFSYCPRAYHGD